MCLKFITYEFILYLYNLQVIFSSVMRSAIRADIKLQQCITRKFFVYSFTAIEA